MARRSQPVPARKLEPRHRQGLDSNGGGQRGAMDHHQGLPHRQRTPGAGPGRMKTTHQKANDAIPAPAARLATERLALTTYEQFSSTVSVLATFSPYLLPACGTFFTENKRGTAWVSAVSDTAIRLEYFEGPFQRRRRVGGGLQTFMGMPTTRFEPSSRQQTSKTNPTNLIRNNPNESLWCPWRKTQNQRTQIQENYEHA